MPREIKPGEGRVALTPAGARALTEAGHRVRVERGAGAGSGIRDEEFTAAGAALCSVEETWGEADLILKVKEPLPEEYVRLRPGLVLFTYLHLAAVPGLVDALRRAGVFAIGYETVEQANGALPLLTPMSEVAGRLSVQEGASYLARRHGGRGILLSGVPGVPRGNVVILGAGTVGRNAAHMALGLGADVAILDRDLDRLRGVDELFQRRATTVISNRFNIAQAIQRADLLIGAVLVAGARAPVLVTRPMLDTMKEGAVIVDVAVDQGGCVETIRPTTVLDPAYIVAGVLHLGVANLPALVPRTSTFALTNATLPYVMVLAERGVERAVREDVTLARGVNVWGDHIVHPGVAASIGERHIPLSRCPG